MLVSWGLYIVVESGELRRSEDKAAIKIKCILHDIVHGKVTWSMNRLASLTASENIKAAHTPNGR